MNGLEIKNEKAELGKILSCAGAYVAWVIGSGFATGQEILQFFTSYGYMSYVIVLINLAGFILIGGAIMEAGYENRNNPEYNVFRHFMGQKLGTVYWWFIPISLVPVSAVLVSGAGETLHEYYGMNHIVGAALMAVLLLIAYVIGFERLIKILGFIGPCIIAFCMLVSIITVFRDAGNLSQVPAAKELLDAKQSSPFWLVSSVLYFSYNILDGGTYYTELGSKGSNFKTVRYGAIFGSILVIVGITLINTAILSNAGDAAALSIPTLYLARKISYVLGAAFSVFLIMGIFSASSAMIWTICSRFETGNRKRDVLLAVGIVFAIFILGLFDFGALISFLYPIIGYFGILFTGAVLVKRVRKMVKLAL